MSATNALSARLIGAIFLERGLVTEEQLQAALAQQAETKEHLGEILVQQYGVSRIELAGVLAEQWAAVEEENSRSGPAPAVTALEAVPLPASDAGTQSGDGDESTSEPEEERRPLGEIFVEQGFVTDEQLDQALETQRNGGEKLGEILVSQGSITRLQLASALADQWTTLKKIRPPSSPPEQPAPALAVVPPPGAPPAAAQSAGAPPADVDQLRDAVAALEQRLRVAESVAAREPWREEIGSATALLQHTVADIEERLAQLATREELAPVEHLRTEFDELAGRVESLASSERVHEAELTRKVDSAAESAEAARSGFGGAFESMSLRLAAIEARVHDRSEITELQKELEALVARVAELSNTLQSSEADGLRDEVQRLLDEVTRRGPAAPGDPALAERIDTLAAHVDEIALGVRGLDTATGSTQQADALGEALAALAARVQALEGGSEPDALADLRGRLDEVERQSSEMSVGNPQLEEQIAGLATRLHALESSATTEELTELRRTVEDLALRPAGDPALAARVEQLARELEQASSASPELEKLRVRVDEVAAQTRSLGSVAEDVEALRSRLGELHELTSRLDAVESEAGRLDELRRRLDDLSARPAADPALVEQLSRRLESVSGTASQLEELRGRLDELAAQVGAPPEAIVELQGRVEDLAAKTRDIGSVAEDVEALRSRLGGLDEIASRLEAVESDAAGVDELRRRLEKVPVTASQLEELRGRLDEFAGQVGAPAEGVTELRGDLAGLEQRLDSLADKSADAVPQHEIAALAARLQALEAGAAGPELEELRSRVEKLAAKTRGIGSVAEDVEALRSRLGGLDELATRLDAVETGGAGGLDELRRRLDDLSARPAADPELVEQLSRRFERVSVTTSQLEELRGRLDELAAQVGAPPEGIAELRGDLAGLEQRLDSIADKNVDAEPQVEVAALAARLHALESSASGDELAVLRRRVEELAQRPAGDPALAERVEQLTRELEQSSATGAQLEELRTRVEELARSHEEDRSGADSRLETITGELRRALAQLGTRLDTVEVTAAEERPDEYGPRIESLESRLHDGATRELALDKWIDVVTARLAALDELRARSRRPGRALRRTARRAGKACPQVRPLQSSPGHDRTARFARATTRRVRARLQREPGVVREEARGARDRTPEGTRRTASRARRSRRGSRAGCHCAARGVEPAA